jgi:hypothetical protein
VASTTCCTWPTTPWCWASATPNGAATAPSSKKTWPWPTSLDLIGQARLLYQLAAARLNAEGARCASAWPAGPVTEDTLAYFRDDREFRNYTLLELPHPGLVPAAGGTRDYATTIVRNFFYAALMVLVWERLAQSADAELAAIAAKSLKEVRYHLHTRATGWCAWATAPTNRTGACRRRWTPAALHRRVLVRQRGGCAGRARRRRRARPARRVGARRRRGAAEATLSARPPSTATCRRASRACIPST